jgi:hypothetical protein
MDSRQGDVDFQQVDEDQPYIQMTTSVAKSPTASLKRS